MKDERRGGDMRVAAQHLKKFVESAPRLFEILSEAASNKQEIDQNCLDSCKASLSAEEGACNAKYPDDGTVETLAARAGCVASAALQYANCIQGC